MRQTLWSAFAAGLLVMFVCAVPAPVQAQGQPSLSPSQAAFLKAESRRIEDTFVARVAVIVRTQPERVRQAMPDERRITVAVSRLIAALEQDLGVSLTDEQKAAILEADEYRKQSLGRVREGASQR